MVRIDRFSFAKLGLLLGVLLMSYCSLSAQADSLRFPVHWEGEWAGELVISNGTGTVQQLPMILRITPVDSGRHTFTIVYGEDTEENTRPYFLETIDRAEGHFITNEDNGILLDDFLIAGKLYSRFEVMGNLLLSTLELRDGQLLYEIISGPLEPLQVTGDTIVAGEEIPPVSSYRIGVRQWAVLTKKE